tara:strand:+ start:297 stop:521 length:225 start_codon:yes stop_codon:yes gene_type:complete
METKSIIDLVEKIESLIPSGTSKMTDEFRDALKKTVENHLHQLDLVTREEFDVQKQVLLKTREKIEALEKKLNN